MPATIKTSYDLREIDEGHVVSEVTWTNDQGEKVTATLNDDGFSYTYKSNLMTDKEFVVCPQPMGLANCILNAYINLGLIPPHNFDPIPSPNVH